MRQRIDEQVHFISRTFLAAVIAIVVGAGVLLALFYQRNNDEGWARHSREVSRLARELQIIALQRMSVLRGHVAFGGPISTEALGMGDPRTGARLDSLIALTAAEATQQARARRIAAGFAQWDSAVAVAPPRPFDPLRLRTDRPATAAADTAFQRLSAEIDTFLTVEERLYERRIADAHRLDRLFIISASLALVIMLVTLYLMRRRLLAQADDQVQALDDLQASETRFRTLVESLHDVVFTLGHEKRYTGMYGGSSVNADSLGQYIGKNAAEILGPEQGQVHLDAADRALHGETVSYDWSSQNGAETRHYNVTVSPLRGPHGEIRGVVGINREVTEQLMREKALADAREQLRQAQRLDALGQLAGGVAHDFNNLLTVIMTYAAILHEEAPPNSDGLRSIEEISRASERAAALTRQLLAFGRRQMLQPRAIDLNETVREVERMLRRLLPPDIAFETSLAPSLGLVMADPGQIEQVLINLAINARDAMPEGGRLTITTANAEPSQVTVMVADTGVGMSPETMGRIFEPFFTTKGVGKGTGLGLATVHGIIEQSGGRVHVESQIGRGTTFCIRLPRHVAGVLQEAPAASRERDLRGTETILLVDDNEELRRVVKRMLARAGYEVREAGSGTAALAQLDRGAAADIVLTDVMMPDMNGRTLMEALRQRHRSVRLLLMSGYNYDVALRGMAERGDVAFIEKPFTAEKLLRKLREVLGQPQNVGAG